MFKQITTLTDLMQWHQDNALEIGLVPTMGNLHAGHISLVKASLAQNPVTIVTIFVNPKQFGPNEDFDSYPRTLEADCELLKEALAEFENKQLIVYSPKSNDEIYPKGFQTAISVGSMTEKLCGADRPGHFDGVTTVVYRLFKISRANRAYFGQKDFQQVQVIRRMIKDLDLEIDLEMLPISRDNDGLARSSRNQYLSEDERAQALTLPRTLDLMTKILSENSWLNSGVELNKIIETTLVDSRWKYLEILDANLLEEVNENTSEVVIAGAFKVGKTRLIDNRLVKINYA
ncbi:pantoate--beta-alanine ligase [Bacteriovorax sp. DB6_IX]|uniref:pantoate--beta-alanine ligase n=1 Tax=Bacteriovorax sp. DB6_IX TaxID=1353530 RepID=UPI00038A4ED8|nr:pantoate--beta-alanine ligase [Bacteriovorax sp. DB6_IX]EQC52385.1 pantoate--beta-alanine ligase [Bacteriovorax sp. DB6_IX]